VLTNFLNEKAEADFASDCISSPHTKGQIGGNRLPSHVTEYVLPSFSKRARASIQMFNRTLTMIFMTHSLPIAATGNRKQHICYK
jgi:hypothetical protein